MALARPLVVGVSGASKAAREGGNLEVTVETEEGPRTFTLPWFFVRDVDALLERWRREEHEATLLTMNHGMLGATLCQAAGAGGLHVRASQGYTPVEARGHAAVVALFRECA